MLNRALIFSIVAILFLLVLQGAWLARLIDNEMVNFREEIDIVLNESIKRELNSRLQNLNRGKGFNVVVSNQLSENSATKNRNVMEVDIKSDKKSFTDLSLDQIMQELYKKDNPLNLDSLTIFFSDLLTERGKSSAFTLEFHNENEVQKTKSEEENKGFIFLIPSFDITIPLTVSKDLLIKGTIHYPTSIFKGDLLIILMLSLILTLFILFSIITQTKMLFKQVSLAKVKENITHFLTHELRSPLQSSITNLEVGEISEGANSKYFLGKAKEQLNLLNSLIENILDINKFEKKQSPLTKALFNINEAIEPHIARHNVNTQKSVTIGSNVPQGAENFFGDRLHITNAIGNLVDNAVKYSNDPVVINVSISTSGKNYVITVQDNGIGIPKDEQSKVFEKFYRVGKREHAQKGKGFGLGLTYVMWVVKAHKGTIRLESEVGTGSKFSLVLKNEEYGTEDIIGR